MSGVPPAFVTTTVTIPAAGQRTYRSQEWDDALVLVTEGMLELVCRDGQRLRFHHGEPLFLAGLPLLALRSARDTATTLIAVRRSRADRRRCAATDLAPTPRHRDEGTP